MKAKIMDVLGYISFLLMFVVMIPVLMVYGAIATPIRYYKNVSDKVHNKEVKRYEF